MTATPSMKTIGYTFKLFAGLLALCCFACTKAPEDELLRGVTISAITEEPLTKTTLSGDDYDGYDVLWSADDFIEVYFGPTSEATAPYIFTLTSGAGTTEGEFTCEESLDLSQYTEFEAFYGLTDGKWPHVQPYHGEAGIPFSPMRAVGIVKEGVHEQIKFKSMGGLLRFTLKGSGTLTRLVFKGGKSNNGIITGYTDSGAAIFKFDGSGSSEYSIDLGENGVQLSETGTKFYFALPEGQYSSVEVKYQVDGLSFHKELAKDKTLVIKRGHITSTTIGGLSGKKQLWFKRVPYTQLSGTYDRLFRARDALRLLGYGWDGREPYSGEIFTTNTGIAPDQIAYFGTLDQTSIDIYAREGLAIWPSHKFYPEDYDAPPYIKMPIVVIPDQQKVTDGEIDPEAEIAAGKINVDSSQSNPAELQNLCAIISFVSEVPMSKAVFTSKSEEIASSSTAERSGIAISWNDKASKWELVHSRHSNTSDWSKSVTVTSAVGGQTFTNAKLVVYPKSLTKGYTLDIYDKYGTLAFTIDSDSPVSLNAGEVTDIGTMKDNTESVFYICYKLDYETNHDEFLYIKDGKKITTLDNPIRITDSSPRFIQNLEYDYTKGENCPAPGQKCDLHIFYGGALNVGDTPTIDGHPTKATGKSATINSVLCNEYVLEDFVMPLPNKVGKVYYVTISATGVPSVQAYLPYCWPIEPVSVNSLPTAVFISDGQNRFVHNTAKNFDYNLMTSDFNLKDCIWKPMVTEDTDAITLSQTVAGASYYFQHQKYRKIGYISKDTRAIDLWGWWTWDTSGYLKHGDFYVTDNGTEVGATDLADYTNRLRLLKMAPIKPTD